MSQYNVEELSEFLRDKPLDNFVSERCFLKEVDYGLQTPSIHPLGRLSLVGSAGIGWEELWVTEDDKLIVSIDSREGTVVEVRENK